MTNRDNKRKKPVNPLAEYFLFAGLVFFARVFGQIPPEIGSRTGAAMGRLFYRFSSRYRRIATCNLHNAYPEKTEAEIKKTAKAVFENIGKILYEVCWSTCMKNDELCRHVTIHGMQYVRRAYEKGKGVLVLTAHVGNWEMLSVVGELIGYPTSIVYRPLDAKPLERFTVKMRTRFGTALIPKKKAFRKIMKRLDRKEMVALLMDQNVAIREGVFAPFFNIPACTNKGLALLALKTGAPVVPIFVLRMEKGYKGLILPEIPLLRTGDKIKDIEFNTTAYNQVIEDVVRQYPEQWFWVHRRWNTRPFSPWPKQLRDAACSKLKRG